MTGRPDILPERAGETDGERRLRETINRYAGKLMTALDAAMALRTAPAEAQRTRHLARNNLLDFGLQAMHAHALAHSPHEAERT